MRCELGEAPEQSVDLRPGHRPQRDRQRLEVEDGIGTDASRPSPRQLDLEPAFVAAVSAAGEKPPPLQALDLLRSRALRNPAMPGDVTEGHPASFVDVVEQLTLVLR